MKITTLQMKKILSSKTSFSQLGFNMLITRLAKLYMNDPSDKVLLQCAAETNAFLEKYQQIMQKDVELISRL
ncbi:MAG: hypothetical protein KBA30_00210 [Clostridia bacterium]|nr:hypothetical protein [Clostridia bacterium]